MVADAELQEKGGGKPPLVTKRGRAVQEQCKSIVP